jgi:alpha-beta hydrolase superfamily lysophospholipase
MEMQNLFKRSESHIASFDNSSLFFQEWTQDKPKGLIVITHGHGEHTDSYNRLTSGVFDCDFSFCAWDWRGHGRSEGKRGYAAHFNDYCKDYYSFLKFLNTQEQYKNLPWIVLGHSMGGLIQLVSMVKHAEEFPIKAQILSAPLTGLSVDVPLIKDLAALLAFHIYPKLTLWNELKTSQFSSDPAVLEEYSRDPLRHDQISPGVYIGILKILESLQADVKNIHLPTLMQLAGKDSVVSSSASEKLFKLIGAKIKKLIIYENSLHEIYNDVYREEAYEDILEFVRPFAKSAGR